MRLTIGVLVLLFSGSLTYGQAIPSLVIPPSNEPTIVFSTNGVTYLVGQRSGKVTTLDATPAPDYPVPQPTPANLTPLQKAIWTGFQSSVPVANRKAAADALILAADAALGQTGGLGLKGQQIVTAFTDACKTARVGDLASGFKFGDILTANNVATDEQFLAALKDLKIVMEQVK